MISIIVKSAMTPASSLLKYDWFYFAPIAQFVPEAHRLWSQSTDGATITAVVPEGKIENSLHKDSLLTTLAVP